MIQSKIVNNRNDDDDDEEARDEADDWKSGKYE
jgi:hypothetical protein